MAEENTTIETSPHKGGLPTPAWAAIAVAALIVGALVGHFAFRGESSVSLNGETTCTEEGSTAAPFPTAPLANPASGT